MSKWLRKVIDGRITIPTYLFLLSSLLLGIVGLMAGFDPKVSASPFANKLVIGLLPWAFLVTVGNLLTIVGIITKNRIVVQIGSMLTFCMWIFGSIAFSLTGQIQTFIVITGPYLLFFAYVYLASFFRRFD